VGSITTGAGGGSGVGGIGMGAAAWSGSKACPIGAVGTAIGADGNGAGLGAVIRGGSPGSSGAADHGVSRDVGRLGRGAIATCCKKAGFLTSVTESSQHLVRRANDGDATLLGRLDGDLGDLALRRFDLGQLHRAHR
jgi:hypothetical protein